jgi:LysR family cys regulon transcriptional activator
MTLTQLRYLVSIIEHGFNISKAAATLHTSQPGISRQVRLLEQQLGINILARRAGRIVGVTEHGERVINSAKAIMKEVGSLKLMGDEMLGQETGELRIAALHGVALTLLPQPVVAVRNAYPEVVINVQQASATRAFDLLRAGEIELGVTIEAPPPLYGLTSLSVKTIPRVLLVPEGHELLTLGSISLKDIAGYPMVFSSAVTVGSWDVLRAFQKHDIEVSPAVYAMDASVIKSFVRHGAGIAVLSGASYVEENDPGLRAINVSHLFQESSISIVFDPYTYMRGYVYKFIEVLAPQWTKSEIEQEIRSQIYAGPGNEGEDDKE